MFTRDQWLSDVLEVPCFRSNGLPAGMSSRDVVSAMTDTASRGAAFFAVMQASRDLAAVETLTRSHFNVVDMGVTLSHDGTAPDGAADDDIIIDAATARDEDSIVDLAGRCFTFSRFHADRQIGAERANRVKREWMRNACRGRAAVVYVARRAGEVAGFLAVLTRDTAHGNEAAIDLIGVDARHQGQGIGRALSRRFIGDWRGRAARLRVGTQAANIPALRLYESLGFRVMETAYALHAHVVDGEVVS